MKQRLYLFSGIVCVVSGIIGMFLPLWPTTPFLLAAALLFEESSPRLHRWMTANEYLGSFLRHYREKSGVPRRIVYRALLFLWGMLLLGALGVDSLWQSVILFVIGCAVSVHLLSLRCSSRAPLHFTLMELLISIGVIAVLAGMLLPALNRARILAQNSICANNLKQIGLALPMYADDFNDRLPALASGFDGSCMILRMPPLGVLGLGRLVNEYGTMPQNYGCPRSPTRTPGYMTSRWPGNGFLQDAYLFRHEDEKFHRNFSHPSNSGKATVMDFCCVIEGGSSIPAHDYQDVNILYSDGSVENRKNSVIPKELYTVTAAASMFGSPTPQCQEAWQNADR